MQVLQPATDFLLSNNLSYHSFFIVRIKIYLQLQDKYLSTNTPMMIKVNSILYPWHSFYYVFHVA